ncbi:hypothetical protein AAH994_14225 [Weeksellaceae bacterium A-14]
MVGSFKVLKIFVLLCFFVGCNSTKEQSEIGENIINDNADLFISNLFRLPSKDTPIFVIKNVGFSNFIIEHCEAIIEMGGLSLIENCKKDLFELINKEGFDINENTKYASFDINEFSSKHNVKLKTKGANIEEKEYIKVIFSNFFVDNKKGRAFIIVQESDVSRERKEGKVNIYFFAKKNSKWLYMKKRMLLTT